MRAHWQINTSTVLEAHPGQKAFIELKTPIYSISLDLEDATRLARALDEAITFSDEYASIAKIVRALDKAVSERTNP